VGNATLLSDLVYSQKGAFATDTSRTTGLSWSLVGRIIHDLITAIRPEEDKVFI